MKIPGVTAKHAIITDTCRANRSDMGAFEEAVSRLREEYILCLPNQPEGTQYHLVLSIERPEVVPNREQAKVSEIEQEVKLCALCQHEMEQHYARGGCAVCAWAEPPSLRCTGYVA